MSVEEKALEQKEDGTATVAILKSRIGGDGVVFENILFDNDSMLIDEPTDDDCVLEAIAVGENEGMAVLHTHRSPQPSGGAGNEENKSTLLKLKAFLRRISPSSSPRVQPDVQTWGNGEFSELSGADLERLLK